MNEKGQDWGDFVNRYTSQSSRHSSPDREQDFMRLTPSPISPLFSSAEKQFCRRDNIDQCVAYLNQVGKMCRDDFVFDASSLVLTRLNRYHEANYCFLFMHVERDFLSFLET